MLDPCMFAQGGRRQEEIAAVGDRGKIEAYLPSTEVSIGLRDTSWFSPITEVVSNPDVRFDGHHHGSSFVQDLKFIDSIRTGAPPEVALDDGLLFCCRRRSRPSLYRRTAAGRLRRRALMRLDDAIGPRTIASMPASSTDTPSANHRHRVRQPLGSSADIVCRPQPGVACSTEPSDEQDGKPRR